MDACIGADTGGEICQTKSFSPDRPSLIPEVLISSLGVCQPMFRSPGGPKMVGCRQSPVQSFKPAQGFHVNFSVFTSTAVEL